MKRKPINIPKGKTLSISFYREADGNWYADVPSHTKNENLMVAGSNTFLQACLDYVNKYEPEVMREASVTLSVCYEEPKDYMFKLTRVLHDPWGATYKITPNNPGFEMPAKLCWLCNVTHTVLGEHPKTLYVVSF